MTSLCESYDWNSLGNGTLVDVGGGVGHVSIFLAKVLHAIWVVHYLSRIYRANMDSISQISLS